MKHRNCSFGILKNLLRGRCSWEAKGMSVAGFSALLQGCWHGDLHATTHTVGWINKVESVTVIV